MMRRSGLPGADMRLAHPLTNKPACACAYSIHEDFPPVLFEKHARESFIFESTRLLVRSMNILKGGGGVGSLKHPVYVEIKLQSKLI